ncbi:MAG TPA: DUF4276 family protein [Thermodesulfovibrionales bacterium]|nr:DUF4276 family protein [Thermodesulfovibrionales bacterium]
MFFEILLEGASDVPVVREILTRKFNLKENIDFRIHPHRGKGKLPQNPLSRPDTKSRGLLDQLPAKLRGYSHLPDGCCVVVLVDADSTDCKELKGSLVELYERLDKKPRCILLRVAVEETESWFIADTNAIRSAYHRAKVSRLENIAPDSVVAAWERLAEVLGRKPQDCDGGVKQEWATKISPFLDLEQPRSPSLKAFVNGIERLVSGTS